MPSTDLGAGDTEVNKADGPALKDSLPNRDGPAITQTHSRKKGNKAKKGKAAEVGVGLVFNGLGSFLQEGGCELSLG